MKQEVSNRTILAWPVLQNQQEFMVGVFTIDQLLQFTKYTKRLIVGYDDDNIPIYNKRIQRTIENNRVEKIADFLTQDPEATFPTNIVLHIPIQAIEKQVETETEGIRLSKITLSSKVFDGVKRERENAETGDIYLTIIDGQHRIRGIEVAIERLESEMKSNAVVMRTLFDNDSKSAKKTAEFAQRLSDLKKIQVVVSFFIDKSLEYQAMIFSTINRTQKRVSESLVYSLFGLNTEDSPHKTALQISLALNAHPKSPFYKRINLYGGSYERNQSPPLSQAAMVKSIIDRICENTREAELDRYRERTELKTRPANSKKVLPFRKWYANNEDTKISDILFFYFSAVRDTFKKTDGTSYWEFHPESMKPQNALHATVGYLAFLDLLTEIIEKRPSDSNLVSKQYYQSLLSKATSINFENLERYPFTSRTSSILYLDLSLAVFPSPNPDDPRKIKLKEYLGKN
jgi:DGQHR domain-containing protein